ncbi:hypothetical protein V6N12_048898 [Hibiscus sabdariffa]|uniref:Uncharacterized protein n=1 Tax=Hibiscus sabdariffa TaxID=183260 RepID=A0ABR2EIM1_9ROSI
MFALLYPITTLAPEQYHAVASKLMQPHHLHYKRSRSRGIFNCGFAFQQEPKKQNQPKNPNTAIRIHVNQINVEALDTVGHEPTTMTTTTKKAR